MQEPNSFDRWIAMAELQLKFLDARGSYRIKVAEAELKLAQAEYERAKTADLLEVVKSKKRLVNQMNLDFNRVNRNRYRMEQRVKLISSSVSNVSRIRNGERLDSRLLGLLWQGFDFFYRLTSQSIIDQIMSMKIDNCSRSRDNFVLVRDKSFECQNVSSDLENVLELIGWIRLKNYMPRIGKPAYGQILTAFNLIASGADSEIAKLREDLASIEDRTYDIWKPVELLGMKI